MPKFLAIYFSGEVRSNPFGPFEVRDSNGPAYVIVKRSFARSVLPVIISSAFVCCHDTLRLVLAAGMPTSNPLSTTTESIEP